MIRFQSQQSQDYHALSSCTRKRTIRHSKKICERHQKPSQIWIIQKNCGISLLNTCRNVLNQTPKTKPSPKSQNGSIKKLLKLKKGSGHCYKLEHCKEVKRHSIPRMLFTGSPRHKTMFVKTGRGDRGISNHPISMEFDIFFI